jgi:hypothetical protein
MDAGAGRDFLVFTGYAMGAAGVPFVGSDRHRIIGSIHGSITESGDRFSSPRLGGGPQPFGEEYGSVYRPVLPGAVIDEYYPESYVVAVLQYRWEIAFFTYLGIQSSVAYLDRDRRLAAGITRKEDVLTSVGAQLTTGFLGETRLQINYNYNFGVIRRDGYGAHEVVAHLSKDF